MEKRIEDGARALISKGADKAKVKGFLMFEGMKEADANKALKELGLIRKMGNFRDALYAALEKGPMDEKTFKASIATATDNAKKHESHYNAVRELVNGVWAAKAKAPK